MRGAFLTFADVASFSVERFCSESVSVSSESESGADAGVGEAEVSVSVSESGRQSVSDPSESGPEHTRAHRIKTEYGATPNGLPNSLGNAEVGRGDGLQEKADAEG